MKYAASKHYNHLDPSEPIPEIELRYNEHQRVGYQAFSRIAVWALATLLGLQFAVHMLIGSHWIRFGVSMVLAISMAACVGIYMRQAQRRASTKLDYEDTWGIPVREQVRYILFYGLLMWGMTGGLRVGTDGLLAGIFGGSWYVIMLGIALALMGRFAREPGQLSCAECDYPLVGLTIPCGCPECGAYISDLIFVTDRPRARDSRLMVIGVLLFAVSLVTIVLQFYRPQVLYNAMPREALLRLASRDPGAFDEIMATAITPDEEQRLIDVMYKNRVGFVSASTSFEQEDWFGTMIGLGRLDSEQLDELFAEYVACSIAAPKRAAVGEPVQLTLTAEYARAATHPPYYFAGFVIGDDPTPHARSAGIHARTFIVNGPEQEHIDRGYVPVYTWHPSAPGRYTIRARVVFAMGTGYKSNSTVTWSSDELPEFPNEPMWSKVIDLEHMIEVHAR